MHKGKPKSRAPVAVHEETDFLGKLFECKLVINKIAHP